MADAFTPVNVPLYDAIFGYYQHLIDGYVRSGFDLNRADTVSAPEAASRTTVARVALPVMV